MLRLMLSMHLACTWHFQTSAGQLSCVNSNASHMPSSASHMFASHMRGKPTSPVSALQLSACATHLQVATYHDPASARYQESVRFSASMHSMTVAQIRPTRGACGGTRGDGCVCRCTASSCGVCRGSGGMPFGSRWTVFRRGSRTSAAPARC